MAKNEIDLVLLKQAINLLLDRAVSELGDTSIEISSGKDLYWEVLPADIYKLDTPPKELGAGSLIDDNELLTEMIRNIEAGTEPIVHTHDPCRSASSLSCRAV